MYAQFVTSGLDGVYGDQARELSPPSQPPRQQGRPAQLGTLCRRYLAVIASERSYLAVLGILPIVVGALIRAVPAPHGVAGPLHQNADASSLLLTSRFPHLGDLQRGSRGSTSKRSRRGCWAVYSMLDREWFRYGVGTPTGRAH
jgi:hypothetical protein